METLWRTLPILAVLQLGLGLGQGNGIFLFFGLC